MAIPKVTCPECGAGLKSPTGFAPGEAVSCPKCEFEFTVEDPDDRPRRARVAADDAEDDRPRRKGRRVVDDDENDADAPKGSYKTSPARFVVLGVLVVVMIVLGVMLYQKRQREAKENESLAPAAPAAVVA